MALNNTTEKQSSIGGRPRCEGFTIEQHTLLAPELYTVAQGLRYVSEALPKFYRKSSPIPNRVERVREALDNLQGALADHAGEIGDKTCYFFATVEESKSIAFVKWARTLLSAASMRRGVAKTALTVEEHRELARELYALLAGFHHITNAMNRSHFKVVVVENATRVIRSLDELIITLATDLLEREGYVVGGNPYRFHTESATGAAAIGFPDTMLCLFHDPMSEDFRNADNDQVG